MARDRYSSRYSNYNIDRLESVIVTAMIANEKMVFIPKRLAKMAKQMLKIKKLNDIKIKTY